MPQNKDLEPYIKQTGRRSLVAHRRSKAGEFRMILMVCIHIYIYIIPNYLLDIGQEAINIPIYLFSALPVLVPYRTGSTILTSSALLLGLFAFRPHSSAFRSSLIVSAFPNGDSAVRVTYLWYSYRVKRSSQQKSTKQRKSLNFLLRPPNHMPLVLYDEMDE